jgi:hypothetical protein
MGQQPGCQAPPAPVAKTAQTISYATGDDGDLQKGVAWPVPRFTDNGNGTVADNLTGLIWTQDADCAGTKNWYDALDYCNALADGTCNLSDGSIAGDWRLANIKEYFSLIDFANYNPALPNDHPFGNIVLYRYWSGTSSGASQSYIQNLIQGNVDNYDVTHLYSVWCVRGGQ